MTERATDGEGLLQMKATPEDPTPMLAAEIIDSQNRPAEWTIVPRCD
jgi:hypothetical protein